MLIPRLLVLLPTVLLMSCAGSGHEQRASEKVRHGMSQEELRQAFGSPLTIQRHPDGSQDWIYAFFREEVYYADSSGRVIQMGGTAPGGKCGIGTFNATQKQPVHLSPDGRVMGAIPLGQVVINYRE
jgi:hypothetical protein